MGSSSLSFSMLTLLVVASVANLVSAYECPDNLGIFTDYSDRSSYWICVNYVPFRQHCPEPLEFDSRYKQCKLDEEYVLQRYRSTGRPSRYTTPRSSRRPWTTPRRGTNGPWTSLPWTSRPGTGWPATGRPGTGRPATGRPWTSQPWTSRPGTGWPGTGRPGTGRPGTGQPGTGRPGTGRPGTDQPWTSRPYTSRPGTGWPATGRPGTGRPGTGQPWTSRYDTTPRYWTSNYRTDGYESTPGYWTDSYYDGTSSRSWTSRNDGWEVERGTGGSSSRRKESVSSRRDKNAKGSKKDSGNDSDSD